MITIRGGYAESIARSVGKILISYDSDSDRIRHFHSFGLIETIRLSACHIVCVFHLVGSDRPTMDQV